MSVAGVFNNNNEDGSSLNIVLGHSVRAAIRELRTNSTASIVCIISPSPRADRRLSDDQLTDIMRTMGEMMVNLTRLEIHYYASDAVHLPARAMAAFLRHSKKLDYLLLNGMRLKGSPEEILDLGHAFREHPSLNRMCCFNIQKLGDAGPPLNPMLEQIVKSPKIQDLALRYTNWSSESLGVICDAESQLKTIRLTGKDTLGTDTEKLPMLLQSLKLNTMLTEFRINQCPAPPGTGRLIADMLLVNTSLRSVLVEFQSYLDAVPVAQAMAHGNKTLTTLDMYTASEAVRRVQEERRQRAMQEMRTAGANWRELRRNGAIRNITMTDEEKTKERQEIVEMKEACVKFLETNTTLKTLVLNTSQQSHVTPQMELYLRMNRDGLRQDLVKNDDLTRDEVLDFMKRYGDDTTLVWCMLRMKPDLISIAIDDGKSVAAAAKGKPVTRSNRKKRKGSAAAATTPAAKKADTATAASKTSTPRRVSRRVVAL